MALFRPRLSIPAGPDADAALSVVETLIESGRCAGQRAGPHVSVTVPAADRSFWSPWLHLEYEPESQTLVGWAGPSPSVWTAFTLGHLGLLTLALGAGVWWFAQRSVGGHEQSDATGWLSLGSLLCSAALVVAGQIGRIGAQEQQEKLVALIAHELGAEGS